MAANGISTATNGNAVSTKIYRRNLKLALATAERSAVGTYGYRTLHVITGTHLAYVSTVTTLVSGTASPNIGHPWITGP